MKAKDVLRLLNITRPTLSKYVKEKTVKVDSEVNGQYIYNDKSIFELLNKNNPRKNVLYARVSTSSQKKDLENQIETLKEFCLSNGIQIHDIKKDISSGMNLDRKQFLEMLDDIVKYKVDKIFITYKDRLARLSFKMIENICKNFGTSIIVLDEIDNSKTIEKEFLEEIVSLIHSFSMKMYSKRRKEKLQLVSKDLELENNIKEF